MDEERKTALVGTCLEEERNLETIRGNDEWMIVSRDRRQLVKVVHMAS